ncbi:MAG: sulfurtransferase [Desulfococcaceae bacterium]
MSTNKMVRYAVIAVILLLGVYWSLASAQKETENGYPNKGFLATADWLKRHKDDPRVVLVDVRTDKYFDGEVIPGAIRLPWSEFRYDDTADNLGELFVGPTRAQEILGQHGIARTDTVVLYDSVKRDGGATAAYFFWVLDVLGHSDKKVVDRGIDSWIDAGGDLARDPKQLDPILYQAPSDEIDSRKLETGDFIYKNLGDPYYRIIDVRSSAEYLGEKGTRDLHGNPLKLGHIPTAINIEYKQNWVDKESKAMKSYPELQELYRGIDPNKGVVVYCASGRRSSFSYFVLRLMGFNDVITYEPSWKEWGNPANFYPVETAENKLTGGNLPGAGGKRSRSGAVQSSGTQSAQTSSGAPKGGYVSCGG